MVFVYELRPEINIKSWVPLMKDLKEGNKKTKWEDRQPYAFWKGNPIVAFTRQDLLKCNVSDKQDWNARVYSQVSISYLFSKIFNFLKTRNGC